MSLKKGPSPANQMEVSEIFGQSDNSMSMVSNKLYKAICLVRDQSNPILIDASIVDVRIQDEQTIVLDLEKTSSTFKHLKLPPSNPKKAKVSINFVDDVFLLGKLTLREMETPKDSLGPINPKEITLVNDIPFLNSAKAAISAEIVSDIKEFEIKGKDFYNSHKDPLAKKIFSAKFKATIIKKYRSMFCHQPLSLYDYKALEAISMIEKIFEIKANILNIPNGGKKVFSMINQARTIQKDIRTHSGGYESIRVANWIDDLLIKVMAFSG